MRWLSNLRSTPALNNGEIATTGLFAEWFAVSTDGPEGETLQEFIGRQYTVFVDADAETGDSGITIDDYSEDCVEYTDTIEAAQAALATYKNELEAILTLMNWITPQLEAEKAAAEAGEQAICDGAIGALDAQKMMIDMLTAEASSTNLAAVNDFLASQDPFNVDGLEGVEYLSTVIVPAIPDAILEG